MVWKILGIPLLASAFAWGQQVPRLAVVDVSAVFRAHPEAKRAEAALEKHRAEARREFDRKANELKGLLQKHQQFTARLGVEGGKATDAQRKEAGDLLEKAARIEREVTELQTRHERDLEQAFLDERRRVMVSVRRLIEEFNSDGTFALVLDVSALSPNGVPQVLHAPGAEDITNAVIGRLKNAR
jgi:Skp family chaperone for outer membrane proteins